MIAGGFQSFAHHSVSVGTQRYDLAVYGRVAGLHGVALFTFSVPLGFIEPGRKRAPFAAPDVFPCNAVAGAL
jgi:hypothetical protein